MFRPMCSCPEIGPYSENDADGQKTLDTNADGFCTNLGRRKSVKACLYTFALFENRADFFDTSSSTTVQILLHVGFTHKVLPPRKRH